MPTKQPIYLQPQPDRTRFALLEFNRYNVTPSPPIGGATIQGTNPIPPVSQPEQIGYDRLQRNRFIVGAIPQVHQGATILDTIPIPPVSQPELRAYTELERNRFIVAAPPQIHQGATVQDTVPIPGVSQPEQGYYLPHNDQYTWEAHLQVSHNQPSVSAVFGGGHGWYF